MKASRVAHLFFVGLGLFFAADTRNVKVEAAAPKPPLDVASALKQIAKQPLRFEENVGQSKSDARFVARKAGASLYLSDGGATLALSTKDKHAELTLSVAGGRDVKPVASEMLVTKTNYILGRDKAKWHTNVANYAKVTYPSVLDGVDVVYHGEDGQLEYDFVVAPGADVAHVAMNIGGTAKLALNDKGDLEIGVAGGTLVQPKPRVYQQDAHGIAHDVDATYRLIGNRRVGFEVASYDHARPLVIDPVIAYSTYLGQSPVGKPVGIAQDSSGNAFIVGTAPSHAFTPAMTIAGLCSRTPTAAQCTPQSLVVTSGPTKNTLVWQSVVDATSYNIYRGTTAGGELPVAIGSVPDPGGMSSFTYDDTSGTSTQTYFYKVAAVTAGGTSNPSNEGSSTLHCADNVQDAGESDVDCGGSDNKCVRCANAARCISSSDCQSYPGYGTFCYGEPTTCHATAEAFDITTDVATSPGLDMFVAKLSDSGALAYYTYIGGPEDDGASAVTVDPQGRAVVVGYTSGNDFPTTDGTTYQGYYSHAALVQLNATGSDLVFGTIFGADQNCTGDCGPPSQDSASGVALNGSTAYVSGVTAQCTEGCFNSNGFLASIPLGGGVTGFTSLGGASANGVAADGSNIYVVGSWTSESFNPVTGISNGAYISSPSGSGMAFLVKLTQDGTGNFNPVWGTYFGDSNQGDPNPLTSGNAIALGAQGHAYITGQAQCYADYYDGNSTNGCTFPTQSAFQTTLKGNSDAYVAHFNTNVTQGSLVYATLLGGSMDEIGNAVAVDPLGHAFVVGQTQSTDFPLANTTATKTGNDSDAFVTELDPYGMSLVLSGTFGGGSNDVATSISYAASGLAMSGWTMSDQSSFPLANAVQKTYSSGDEGVADPFAAKYRILSPIDLEPGSSSVAAGASLVLTASGGAGTGYVFAVSTSGSGGTINPGTGAYTAGTNGGTDIITVTDALGNSASARVVVTANAAPPDLVISPSDATVTPRGNLSFSATGGTPPYYFDFESNASNGTIANSGFYIAGPRGAVVDTVRVTDQAGVIRTATVRVGLAISITPNGASVAAGSTTEFRASGGGGAYQWSTSAGTITAAGSYTAPTSATAATITVRDSLGNTASVNVSVGGAIAITPGDANTYPRGTVHFQAIGGSGEGFKWVLASGASGGTIDIGSGDYTAGSIGNTQDAIEVTDSNGNKASAVITVGPGLSINPPSATANANGQVSFSAAGGSGAGFVFAMISAPSGGSISQQGIYTAGKNGGNDLVRVTDSAGNTAQAQVTAAAAAQSTSSSSSTSSTSSNGGPTTSVPDVDAGDGSNLNLGVGNANGSNSSCAVSTPGSPASSGGAFAGLMLGLALLARRRHRFG